MLAKSTAKLSDLLVEFNVNICVNGKASLKKALKFRDIYSWSNSNIIGLRIPSYSQSFFSLQVVGQWSVSCRRLPALEDSTFGEHFLHFIDDGANTLKLVWSWIVT